MHDPIVDFEAACKAAGVPLLEALKEAGVDRSTWWRWKVGRTGPRHHTLQRLHAGLSRLLTAGEKVA